MLVFNINSYKNIVAPIVNASVTATVFFNISRTLILQLFVYKIYPIVQKTGVNRLSFVQSMCYDTTEVMKNILFD